MTLARLLKIITGSVITTALAWWLYFHQQFPFLAVGGVLLLMLGYALVLAFEFLLVRITYLEVRDGIPRATWRELIGAWFNEVLVAPQVFCWRQPFFADRFPDKLSGATIPDGQRGLILVHGFFCNRGFWAPWLQQLDGRGHAFIALNLEPTFGSIDSYITQIDAAVARLTKVSGMPPVIVCHSMGGLAVRAWLKATQSDQRVHHVVTIGTPHLGTWLARFGQGENSRQMRADSAWQAQLNEGDTASRNVRFTCWYSNSDNIVFPAANAILPGADNRLVCGVAHVQLAFLPKVINDTLARLES